MEITRHNFRETLPLIEEAIKNCDFISIDSEFSGLDFPGNECDLFDSPTERYAKEKKAVQACTLLQVGIGCFTRNPNFNKYEASVFNMFVFPSNVGYNKTFLTEISSAEFLRDHRFDFNKFYYDGVRFLSRRNAEKVRLELESGAVGHREINTSYFSDTCFLLREWLSKANPGQTNDVDVTILGYIQRLIFHYKLLRMFPEIRVKSVNSIKLVVEKCAQEIDDGSRNDEMKVLLDKIMEEYIGCSVVFDMLVASKKPVVGQNLLLDLMFFYEKFGDALPETYESFKRQLRHLLPEIYDTRHVSSSMRKVLEDRGCKRIGLGSLFSFLESDNGTKHMVFYQPHVELGETCKKYGDTESFHEAGYDAYAAGVVFIRLAHIKAMQALQNPPSEPLTYAHHIAAVKPLANRLNLYNANIAYTNLDGDDPISLRPEWLLVSSRSWFQSLDRVRLVDELSRYGSFDIRLLSSSKVLLAVASHKSADAMLESSKDSKHYSVRKYNAFIRSSYAKTFFVTTGLLAMGVLAFSWTWGTVKGRALSK